MFYCILDERRHGKDANQQLYIEIQVAFKYVKKGYDKNRFVFTALWMNVDMGRMRINQLLNDFLLYRFNDTLTE